MRAPAPYQTRSTIRRGRDVVDYLRSFSPKCIASGQDLIEAHRYAAKVELAQYILSLIEGGESDLTYEED